MPVAAPGGPAPDRPAYSGRPKAGTGDGHRFGHRDHHGSPAVLTIRLSGELDLAARPVVIKQVNGALVENADIERVAVDLGEVEFCDSSGLGALLDIRRAAEKLGATRLRAWPVSSTSPASTNSCPGSDGRPPAAARSAVSRRRAGSDPRRRQPLPTPRDRWSPPPP